MPNKAHGVRKTHPRQGLFEAVGCRPSPGPGPMSAVITKLGAEEGPTPPPVIPPAASVHVDLVFFFGKAGILLNSAAGEISLPMDEKAVSPGLSGFYGLPGATMFAPGLIVIPLHPYVGHGPWLAS